VGSRWPGEDMFIAEARIARRSPRCQKSRHPVGTPAARWTPAPHAPQGPPTCGDHRKGSTSARTPLVAAEYMFYTRITHRKRCVPPAASSSPQRGSEPLISSHRREPSNVQRIDRRKAAETAGTRAEQRCHTRHECRIAARTTCEKRQERQTLARPTVEMRQIGKAPRASHAKRGRNGKIGRPPSTVGARPPSPASHQNVKCGKIGRPHRATRKSGRNGNSPPREDAKTRKRGKNGNGHPQPLPRLLRQN
jgi:hypothetical protein